MSFAAKILADSISPDDVRLTTMEVTLPRPVLAEFNTHRMFSRNSASSRAIPVKKMIERVMDDPYVPSSWGKNQKGMQAGEEVDTETQIAAQQAWLAARDQAVERVLDLLDFGIHKQTTNRLLEPFLWHTVIVTATEWSNFFHLRNNPHAHPDIQIPARMMQELYEGSTPKALAYGRWHRPLVENEEIDRICSEAERGEVTLPPDIGVLDAVTRISVARCARVSYLTHDGKRNIQADLDLHDRLLASGHLSPFEHVARPMTSDEIRAFAPRRFPDPLGELSYTGDVLDYPCESFCGNFRGWVQYRKLIPHEQDILGATSA